MFLGWTDRIAYDVTHKQLLPSLGPTYRIMFHRIIHQLIYISMDMVMMAVCIEENPKHTQEEYHNQQ